MHNSFGAAPRVRASAGVGCLVAAIVALAACSGDSGPRSRPGPDAGSATGGARPDKLAIIGLLKLRNYAALEKRLNALQARFEAGHDPKGYLAIAFDAFKHSDPAIRQWLDEWVSRYPRSFAARLARGRYFAHLGWVARGDRFAAYTTQRQMDRMTHYHIQSMRDLRAALKINLRLPSAYCEAIAIHAGHSRADQARAVFEAAEKAVPSASCHIWRLAWFLAPRWHGDDGKALKAMLREAEVRSARDSRYKILRGFGEFVSARGLRCKGCHKEAVPLLDRAIALSSGAAYLLARGRNYMYLGKYDKALADFERVLKREPQNAGTLAAMAELSIRKREFRPAMEYATRALALDPYVPDFLTVRLRARRLGGIPEKSYLDFQKAMVFGDDDPYVQAERAEYLATYDKKPAEARQAWKRAFDLAPDNSYFRRRYWRNLAFANDCSAVAAATTYLRICMREGDCDNSDITIVSSMTNEAIYKGGCPYKKHHVALSMRDRLSETQLARILSASEKYASEPPTTPPYVGETVLDAVTLEGLRPGMSIEEVSRLFPGMDIKRSVHPRTQRLLRAVGTAVRDDGRRHIQVLFSSRGEVYNILSRYTFRSAEKPEAIRRRTIAKYGKPNRETSGPKIGLVYREGGGARNFDAALMIEIERLPESAAAPPGEGEPFRMVSVLSDNRVLERGMKAMRRER